MITNGAETHANPHSKSIGETLAINIASTPDPQHKNREFCISKRVNDSIDTHSYPPESIPAALKRFPLQRIGCQSINRINDPLPVRLRNLRYIF